MKFTLITAPEVDTGLERRWRELVRGNEHLRSPYFSVEFTRAVAAVRDDVRVVVIEDDDGVAGFFPFQRSLGRGRAIGGHLSDQHGVIGAPDLRFDARGLLRAARLTSWEFDHLPAVQASFTPFHKHACASPIVDLGGGFAAYCRSRLAAGSGRIPQTERKARKLAREVGPVRWEAHDPSLEGLDRVFAQKSEQCRAAGLPDVFASSWSRELVRKVLQTQGDGFNGCLSTLRVGDSIAAVHAGMRSDRAWHWWIPVYDHRFAKYSPGSILLLEVLREAARLGLDHLDLGKGDDHYKQSFANAEIPLAEGRVALTPLGDLREHAELRLRSSRLAEPLRPALRRTNQWMRQRRYR